MAQLYTLLAGTSKKRLKRIMTDLEHKCINYKDAIISSGNTTKYRHFEIRLATEDENEYRRNSSNQWTAYNSVDPKFTKVKNGRRKD